MEQENIKIEKINGKEHICPECFYIVGTKDPQKQMFQHISEKHPPKDLGEKKGFGYF